MLFIANTVCPPAIRRRNSEKKDDDAIRIESQNFIFSSFDEHLKSICNEEIFKQTGLLVLKKNKSNDEEMEENFMLLGYRSNIISGIASGIYKNKELQDKLREDGGIILVLVHCRTDFQNPCL